MVSAAWLVRGGREGEREECALGEGLVIAGWVQLGDLSHCSDKEELRQEVSRAYLDVSKAIIANWTGQLWRFLHEIKDHTLVVMPLKTRAQQVAIGRIVGPYQFRADAAPGFRHVRPVQWMRIDIPRSAVRQDLLDSMGSLLTVCQLKRFGAARRIAALAEHGTDPGPNSDELPLIGVSTVDELIEKAAGSDPGRPFRLTIRELLSLWDATRRTPDVVAQIEADLADHGLTTRPPFIEGWIDNQIDIVPVDEEPRDDGRSAVLTFSLDQEDVTEFPSIALRISNLESANKKVANVRPKDELVVAMTKMVTSNYSQLAVTDEEDTLLGTVSWESIGMARMSGPVTRVVAAMVKPRFVDHDEYLLNQIDEIYRSGYVFVLGDDKKVAGIVTAADLTLEFRDLSRPFVMVEEIERRLRRRVDKKFSLNEIRRIVRGRREVNSAADLYIADYWFLFTPLEAWQRLDWHLDQKLFLDQLDEFRKIRNELMHFTLDKLSEAQLSVVEGFLRMLRTVDPHG